MCIATHNDNYGHKRYNFTDTPSVWNFPRCMNLVTQPRPQEQRLTCGRLSYAPINANHHRTRDMVGFVIEGLQKTYPRGLNFLTIPPKLPTNPSAYHKRLSGYSLVPRPHPPLCNIERWVWPGDEANQDMF